VRHKYDWRHNSGAQLLAPEHRSRNNVRGVWGVFPFFFFFFFGRGGGSLFLSLFRGGGGGGGWFLFSVFCGGSSFFFSFVGGVFFLGGGVFLVFFLGVFGGGGLFVCGGFFFFWGGGGGERTSRIHMAGACRRQRLIQVQLPGKQMAQFRHSLGFAVQSVAETASPCVANMTSLWLSKRSASADLQRTPKRLG